MSGDFTGAKILNNLAFLDQGANQLRAQQYIQIRVGRDVKLVNVDAQYMFIADCALRVAADRTNAARILFIVFPSVASLLTMLALGNVTEVITRVLELIAHSSSGEKAIIYLANCAKTPRCSFFVTKIKVVNRATATPRQTVVVGGREGVEGAVCMQSQFCNKSLKTWLTTLALVLIVVGLALSFAARIRQ